MRLGEFSIKINIPVNCEKYALLGYLFKMRFQSALFSACSSQTEQKHNFERSKEVKKEKENKPSYIHNSKLIYQFFLKRYKTSETVKKIFRN